MTLDLRGVAPRMPSDRAEVVTAAVRAANLWETRLSWADPVQAFRELSHMVGVISLARLRYASERPPPLAALLDLLDGPLPSVVPPPLGRAGDELVHVLHDGRLTDEARDLFTEYAHTEAADPASLDWSWLAAERVEREVFVHMVGTDQATYVAARRALIERAATSEREYADLWNAIGWRPPSGTLVEIAGDRRQGSWWSPCPICGWPMETSRSRHDPPGFACSFEAHRLRGARFLVEGGDDRGAPRLRPLGRIAAPHARRVEGCKMLARGVWRYVTVPGLSELALAESLRRLGEVELWPDLDRVDLRLRGGGLDWEVDVKDWTSGAALAEHIARSMEASSAAPWVIVPDHRESQVRHLREELPHHKVATAREFVRRAKRELNRGPRGQS